MSDLTLVIGNKASSSWSLRPWLALKQIGVPFREITIPLRQPETKAEILQHSPAGKVPVLRDGDLTIYDSLAILEYLAESYPEAGLWPEDRGARAVARSISAEMHSGFVDLRKNMPMDVTDKHPGEGRTPELLADIARITQIWRDAKARFGAEGRSCSAVSRQPMPCTRRSALGWIHMAWSWTRSPKPTSPPCSACRPCASGTQRGGGAVGGVALTDHWAAATGRSIIPSAGWLGWLDLGFLQRADFVVEAGGAWMQRDGKTVQRVAELDRRPLGVPVVEQPARVRVP